MLQTTSQEENTFTDKVAIQSEINSLNRINNINIASESVITSPRRLREQYPLDTRTAKVIQGFRNVIADIIHRRDSRKIVIAGPCSIHDTHSAMEYAGRLKRLRDLYSDTLFIIMRVYFEKPRTATGWKGFINDPHLDDSFDVEHGLASARKLLLFLADLDLPAATEALDPITPQYISDLISWVAIGARTTESQTHREMASGLSMPVGFKNGTDGNITIAINAIKSAVNPHSFLGINAEGYASVIKSKGNSNVHLILRGGAQPNYTAEHIRDVELFLEKEGISSNVIVDCSHGNSHQNYKLQPEIAENIACQIHNGNRSIIGIMLESHLYEGRQPILLPQERMKYGVSITDACINWSDTELAIKRFNNIAFS